MMTAGLGGVTNHGSVALVEAGEVRGVCEQERVTRVRRAGFNASGLPDEALDTLLERLGRKRADISRYVVARSAGRDVGPAGAVAIEPHLALAHTAYLTSPHQAVAILVVDHEAPGVSVWIGRGQDVRPIDWPWSGPSLADVYTRCAALMGFTARAGGQRMEALARLSPDARDESLASMLRLAPNRLNLQSGWERWVTDRCAGADGSPQRQAAVAAALQNQLGDLLLQLVQAVHAKASVDTLCLAGSLFYNSAFNSLVKRRGPFAHVFVPVAPGDAGQSVGAALQAEGVAPRMLSPFLGPAYQSHEIKATLENCKLAYRWESEDDAIGIAVQALQRGHLVGWFDGAMEWGSRALGARCILANPFAPAVLENLNHFLKQREAWRGYALSGLEATIRADFEGPADSPFMECDYRVKDAEKYRPILPTPGAAVRAHTVGAAAPPRFRKLLTAFGAASGSPVLVNTSFNGFHEPIVCSPRDAIRVFFGTGIDVLVFDQFVLMK